MIRVFALALLLLGCVPGLAIAHDSSVATLQLIHLANDKWLFEMKTPLYGLDQALRRELDESAGESAGLLPGSREYKERLVAYVKQGFEVTATAPSGETDEVGLVEVQPQLGAGRLKLNDHQSVLMFEIQDMPNAVEALEMRFGYMSHNMAQHNILRLVDGERSRRYILNVDNAFGAVDRGFFLSESQAPVNVGVGEESGSAP